MLSENDYWINPVSPSDFSVLQKGGKSQLRIKQTVRKTEEGKVVVQADIRNNSKQIATGIKVNVREKESGKSLLPVYVSDGYFNLLPGEEKRIYMEIPGGQADKAFYLSADEWIR